MRHNGTSLDPPRTGAMWQRPGYSRDDVAASRLRSGGGVVAARRVVLTELVGAGSLPRRWPGARRRPGARGGL